MTENKSGDRRVGKETETAFGPFIKSYKDANVELPSDRGLHQRKKRREEASAKGEGKAGTEGWAG